jgi:putative acetyltransferase
MPGMAADGATIIRLYGPSDLDAVIAIFQGSVRKIAATDYNEAQIEAWAHVNRRAWARARLSRPTWLAVIGQEIVGFADLEPDGHLDMMFVHPGFQRRGVATALLERVERSAREQGLSRIFTEASITARPFFGKRGFQLVIEQVVELRGRKLTNFRMEKLLP